MIFSDSTGSLKHLGIYNVLQLQTLNVLPCSWNFKKSAFVRAKIHVWFFIVTACILRTGSSTCIWSVFSCMKLSKEILYQKHWLRHYDFLETQGSPCCKWAAMHCSRLRSSSTLYDIQSDQGRTKVRCCPGQETNLAPSCSNLKSFRSKCTIMKKVPATLLGLVMSPQWFGTWSIVLPLLRQYEWQKA